MAYTLDPVTVGDLRRDSKALEIGCMNCDRYGYFDPHTLALPDTLPVPETPVKVSNIEHNAAATSAIGPSAATAPSAAGRGVMLCPPQTPPQVSRVRQIKAPAVRITPGLFFALQPQLRASGLSSICAAGASHFFTT